MSYTNLIFNLRNLEGNLKKSRDEILDIREKKFRKILNYAYNNSSFYHELYSSHGINEGDLLHIPINELPSIDKKILIDNFDNLVTRPELKKELIEKFVADDENLDNKYLGKYSIVHSSGSTGLPTYFIYDKRAWEFILAAAIRAAKGNMTIAQVISYTLKGLRVAYIAATDGRYGGVMAASSGIKGLKSSPLLLNVNLPLEQWVDKIVKFNPNFIIGYPSAIKILCELVEVGKVSVDAIKVISVGEPLTKHMREYIEKSLEAEAINIYGASESIVLGMETGYSDGIYIFDDINYLEVIDGATYITSLYNYSQPLIRYKLSDKLNIRERTTSELLPYTKLESIMGRNEDIMWFINKKGSEDFLHPLVIDEVAADGLLNYQFVQYSKENFDILAEIENGSDRNSIETRIKMQMDRIIKEKNLENIKYQIKFVDDIPVNPSTGKKPMVIRKLA